MPTVVRYRASWHFVFDDDIGGRGGAAGSGGHKKTAPGICRALQELKKL
jgi:hypothetical protein